MTEKNLKKIEQEIVSCKKQLKDLEPYIYTNAGVAENYNRILIKKAILVDKYKQHFFKKPGLFAKIAGYLKFGKQQKLISDYFPNS